MPGYHRDVEELEHCFREGDCGGPHRCGGYPCSFTDFNVVDRYRELMLAPPGLQHVEVAIVAEMDLLYPLLTAEQLEELEAEADDGDDR